MNLLVPGSAQIRPRCLGQREVIWLFFIFDLSGMAENGKHIEFVKTLQNEFKCGICESVLREPVQTTCGHRYCEDCIKQFIGL